MSKNKECSLELESVYTRVSVYYAWFLNIAGQQPSPDNTATTTSSKPINTDTTTTQLSTTVTTPITTTVETEATATEEISSTITDRTRPTIG